jgi:hypothetical protein
MRVRVKSAVKLGEKVRKGIEKEIGRLTAKEGKAMRLRPLVDDFPSIRPLLERVAKRKSDLEAELAATTKILADMQAEIEANAAARKTSKKKATGSPAAVRAA